MSTNTPTKETTTETTLRTFYAVLPDGRRMRIGSRHRDCARDAAWRRYPNMVDFYEEGEHTE